MKKIELCNIVNKILMKGTLNWWKYVQFVDWSCTRKTRDLSKA